MTFFPKKPRRSVFIFCLSCPCVFGVIFTLFLLLWSSCEKTTTQPPPPAGPDTTSHNFVWRIDTLGEGPQFSSLWDVELINENDIWVVGDLRMKDTYDLDSLGNTIQPYNAAHWDGTEWELKRIFYFAYGSERLINPIRGILSVSSQKFWLAAASIFYWDGGLATLSYLRDINTPEAVNKLWGNPNVYGVGDTGLLVYYDGNTWQKIESHTDIGISSIWGEIIPNETPQIFATVSTEDGDLDSKVLKIVDNTAIEVSSDGLPNAISGIWFNSEAGYYVVGDGIYHTQTLNEKSKWVKPAPGISDYYLESISATAGNDIFIVGHFGTVIHYNGSTWKNYTNAEVPFFDGIYSAVVMKGNVMVAVGYSAYGGPTRGIILTGKRISE